ncbi:O-antigen ligase family protein [Aurantiacibacter odishensis]|uniref:O-antigen ligase family protein n=1 Tax=Aurantiacibacter odishensis TaxID=1155476 RepID=UPI000E76B688|nr:O-antigen ligase family protein [Aurantiacibacter odishensis]
MADSTRDSDAIISSAKKSLQVNRYEGGFHRAKGRSIGRASRQVKMKNALKRAGYFGAAVLAIFIAASVAGMILQGIGFAGVMVAFFAIVAAGFIFANYPKVKVPNRVDLSRTQDAKRLVERTEIWLESQRPALPAPAVTLVDDLGVQLDALGKQLAHVDPAHPAAQETRKLVGEYLPETIDSYRKIPDHLRREERAGSTPDRQLIDSLGKISKEIDHVTRQLAEGSLDDLAIKNRYLDYKYGGEDASLPPPNKDI